MTSPRLPAARFVPKEVHVLFDVQVAEREGCQVLSIVGEVDLATGPQVRQAIIRLLAGSGRADRGLRLVIDLSGVDLIDSIGLGVMIGALRRVRAVGGDLALVVAQAPVAAAFGATDLDRVFAIRPTLAEALAAVTAARDGGPRPSPERAGDG